MRRPDEFDAPEHEGYGCCVCCGRDMDGQYAYLEVATIGKQTWCRDCGLGDCDCVHPLKVAQIHETTDPFAFRAVLAGMGCAGIVLALTIGDRGFGIACFAVVVICAWPWLKRSLS